MPVRLSMTSGKSLKAEEVSREGTLDDTGVVVPSFRSLGVFVSTTILIWISEPLLSLVDTTVVGLTQTDAIVQLASLGPATTLIDSLLYLTYFLAIATTNQLAKDLTTNNYRKLQRTTSHVLGVATILGSIITIFVFVFGRMVLTKMAGASATTELINFATRYTLIRSSVAMASIVGMVMQSFCLTTLDTRTPTLAVAAASCVNVVGDVALSHWGVQGAAVATAASNLVSTSILTFAVRRKFREWRDKAKEEKLNEMENSSSSQANSATDTSISNRPEIPFVSFPDSKSMVELVMLAGPIFFVIVCKIACYGAMNIRCTDFGVTSLAAHSIMMRVFFFFGCFGDSLSQTAQSFMPATLYPKEDKKAFRKILKKLLIIAGVIGIGNSQFSVFIMKRFGKYLANDARIIKQMRNHALFMGLAILLHPFIMLFEGTVIASRDFRTLMTTYTVTLGLHFSILKVFCNSFPAVWRTFFFFQMSRLLNFSWHVWKRQSADRKAEKNLVAA